jgi:aryl-alcohol dehydrogenase-like predicted oxidoreductase
MRDTLPAEPLRFPNANTLMTATVSTPHGGITNRQRPSADRFEDLLCEIEPIARAIDDNAWDEGQPLPAAVAHAWLKQIEGIRQAITNATAAHQCESEGK